MMRRESQYKWKHPMRWGLTLILILLAATFTLVAAQETSPGGEPTGAPAEEPAPVDSLAEAKLLVSEHRYAEAEPLLHRILKRVEADFGTESPQAAQALDLLVLSLWRSGRSRAEETIALANRAVSLNEKLYDPQALELTPSLFNLGVIRTMGGDYDGAEPIFTRVLEIRETHLPPDHQDVITSVNALANVRFYRSDYAGSLPLYRRSLALAEAKGGEMSPQAISIRSNVANNLIQLKDHNEARALLERQIKLLESAGMEIEDLALAYSLLGAVYLAIGDHEEELPLRRRCLEIRQALYPETHHRIAEAVYNLGVNYWKLGDLEEGRRLIEEARSLWEQLYGPENPHMAAFYEGLGRLTFDEGNLKESREFHEQALKIREATLGSDAVKVAEVLQSLGRIALEEGRHADGRAHFQRALSIVEAKIGSESPFVGAYESDLAMIEFLAGDVTAAMSATLSAHHQSREYIRLVLRGLPERQALQFVGSKMARLDLALSLIGNAPGAESLTQVWDAVIRTRAMVLDEMAARTRRQALPPDPQTTALVDEYQRASTSLANLYMRGPGDSDPESYRTQLAEARQAMEEVERELAADSAPYERTQLDEEIGWEEVIAGQPTGTALVAYVLYGRHPVDPVPRREVVPTYGAFILPATGGDPVFVNLGAAKSINAEISRWKNEISLGALRKGRDREASLKSYVEAGSALRTSIWDPLQSHLQEAHRVFVVADGQSHLVNLSSLPVGDSSYLVEVGVPLHYLSAERELAKLGTERPDVDGALVFGAPDFNELDSEPPTTAGKEADGSQLMAMVFRGERPDCEGLRSMKFNRLPGSLQEAQEVAALFESHRDAQGSRRRDPDAPADVQLLTGPAATERAFKQLAPGNRVLHVATHGFFLSGECPSGLPGSRGIGLLVAEETEGATAGSSTLRNPLLLSGLALAGANQRERVGPDEDDGILTAQEIATLDLTDVHWAVLSACETGTGQVLNGEGVFGLQRAFRIAGARTLITSLWSVKDEAARQWMKAFYEARLYEGGETIDAVHNASLSILQSRRERGEDTHPFYWAAFIASGDWR
jgi:CHAT domain-containing protein/tetratricopeptide (TPR) repeat protein